MKIFWKDIFKFLAGGLFVGFVANAYFYLTDISIPLLQYIITPNSAGMRAFIQFGLFLVVFYYGFLKKK